MAVDSFIERTEPGSGDVRDDSHADPILQTEANAALTCILVVAPVAAMVGFGLISGRWRRRGLLVTVAAVAYLVLLGLHTPFLITVARESMPVALPQVTLEQAVPQLFPVS